MATRGRFELAAYFPASMFNVMSDPIRLIFFDPDPVDDGTPIFGVTFDAGTEPPFGEPEVLLRDARRADTPGWSVAVTSDDQVIYLQTSERIDVSYLRVVPGWVDEMKRAVDEANSG